MAERDRFELDLAAALRAYLEEAPTEVRPTELARQFATAHPHRTTTFGPRRLMAVPRHAWILLLLAGLLAALVGGTLIAGSQLRRFLPAVVPPIGQLYECPPGSTPDKPGPVGQARPPEEVSAAAFDRRAGRLIEVTNAGDGIETWTFDVCTNTWAQMHPNREPATFEYAQLVYDIDSDATILISLYAATPGRVWAYDLQANTWTEKGAPSASPFFLAYDPVSGLVVAAEDDARGLLNFWNYDVEADSWASIHQANEPSALQPRTGGGGVLAYDSSVDRIVAYEDAAYGAPPYETWLFDLRTGIWSRSAAARPAVSDWLTAPGIVYDEAAGRTLIFSRDPLTAYDARTDRWEIVGKPETFWARETPWDWVPSAYMYDAVNRRLVGWRVGGSGQRNGAVVAFDLTSRTWTLLLGPGEVQPARATLPPPTSAPTSAPSGGPEEPSPVANASATSTP